MKKRNLFLTLGLALTLGAGVAGGLSLNRSEAKEVEAADGDITGVWLKGTFNSWGTSDPLVKNANGDYVLTRSLAVNDEFKIHIQGTNVEEKWVGFNWGLADANVDYYEFVGEGSDPDYTGQRFKALSTYQLTFKVNSTFYTKWGADVTIKLAETRTVNFVNESGNVYDDTTSLIAESNQFSGLITTTVANAKFRIRDTIGTTNNFHAELEDGVTDAVVDGDYLKIATPGTYAVYYKKGTNKCWVTKAEASQEAYIYANYFLDNVGCDPDGILAPTGWNTVANRYAVLSDNAKDFIYEADEHWTVNDDLYKMIERYNWAINHNPNSLSHFVVNHSGNERAIPAGAINIAPTVSESNNFVPVVVLVSAISLVAVASIFVIRRRKEQE